MKKIKFVLENTEDANEDQFALREALKEKQVKIYQNGENKWVCFMDLKELESEEIASYFFIDADSKVYFLEPANNGERIELFTHLEKRVYKNFLIE